MKLFFAIITLCGSLSVSANQIDGKWIMTDRKCANSQQWEPVDNVSVNFDSTTTSYRVEADLGNCTLTKNGGFNVNGAEFTMCNVVASTAGSCTKGIQDYAQLVNRADKPLCQTQSYSVSGDTLYLSEETNKPGLNCPVGVDVEYRLQRAN